MIVRTFSTLVALSLGCTAYAAPTVAVLNPADSATVPSLTSISVTFSEPVAGVDATDLEVNSEPAASVTGSNAGPYVFTFTQPPSGIVAVSWDIDHGISGLGTGAFAPTGGWSYTLADTIAPTVAKILTSVPGQEMNAVEPLAGSTVGVLTQASVTFSEEVTGVNAGDLLVGGAPATAVTGNGAGPYVFTFPQPAAGSVAFQWAGGHGIVDTAGNAFGGGSWSATLAAGGSGSVVINEFLAANASGLLDENGDTSDWIELRNTGATAVNLAGWSFSTSASRPGQWIFPSRILNAGAYLVVFASGKDRKPASGNLHTNFTLNADGDDLYLFTPNSPRGTAASEFVDYPGQRYNYSYGPQTDSALRYFATPTPNAANGTSALTAITAEPNANVSRGFFKDPFQLTLTCTDPAATIRYTLDGSDPLTTSTAFSAPLNISATTILRMASFSATTVPSATSTHSYIFLDNVITQASPPYDNPANPNDNTNPALPTVSNVPVASGGVQFPVHWGTRTVNPPFPGLVTNLNSGQIPADYGMDPEIINDPNKYLDTGAVNAAGMLNIDRIRKGLRDLPLLSVVLKLDDMFGTANGLYVEPFVRQKTPLIEKPCSVELLMPDGTTAFATTCGIRIHGNASRDPEKNPKHGFKLNFKGSYGASTLAYALFPGSPVEEFDDLILRADFNSSWTHHDNNTQRPKGTRIRDAWSKDTFREMGRAAGFNRHVHLFINGVYWGTYDPAEQENNGFAAAYFGGSKDDYDVYDQGALKAGTSTAYNAMTAIASPIDNTKYEQMKAYLDVPWFIDYMILHFFVGHQDWGDAITKNWYAVRNNKHGGKFKYLPWDMENLLWTETVDRTGVLNPPSGLHPKLVTNAQYRLDFADLTHRHMVAADGALQPAANIARWNKWQAILTNAIACESARWGDYRRDVHGFSTTGSLYTWNGFFITEVNRLKNTYFPARPTNVLNQLRTRGLYPTLNAPEFRDDETGVQVGSQNVPSGFPLRMNLVSPAPAGTSSTGIIYYTTDGSDPRVYYDTTGQRTPGATSYSSPVSITTTTTVKARALAGSTWSALLEATFTVGSPQPKVRITELHYNPPAGQGGSAAEFIEFQNIGSTELDIGNWYFSGINFVVPAGTVAGPGARLVIASNDAPATYAAQYPGVSVLGYFGGTLDNGGERIALHDRAGRVVSSVEFNDEFPWPLAPDGGGYSLECTAPDGDLNSAANWRASAALKGTPGAPNATPPTPPVAISEFLANNAGAYITAGQTPGYVELRNDSAGPVNIGNWVLAAPEGGILFPTNTIIAVGATVVVHFSPAPIPGLHVPAALDVNKGQFTLRDAASNLMDAVRYGPQAANASFSRVSGAWALGQPTPGTPHIATLVAPQSNLRINEWLANPDPGFDDWLEISNIHSSQPVVLTGLLVGTSSDLFRITVPAAVGAGQFTQLFCNRGSRESNALDFSLPAAGTTISLLGADGIAGDTRTFGAQADGVSQGRLPNGTGATITLPFPSPALANYAAITSAPVLNEILAINRSGDNAPWARRPGWIELSNPGASSVALGGWKLRDPQNSAISWTFPTATSIAAGGTLAIWADPNQPASSAAGRHMNCAFAVESLSALSRLELVNSAGQIVDRVVWGPQIPDLSIGRSGGSWTLLAGPTRNIVNAAAATLGATSAVRINEWFATGTIGTPDYIELYNTSALPVALAGIFLSDEPGEVGRRKYQFPPQSYIAGNGFAVINASGGTLSATDSGFALADTGEYLRLALGNDTQLEAIGFGLQAAGASQGRQPEGSTNTAVFAGTRGAPNVQGTGPWFTAHPASRAVIGGGSTTLVSTAINATSFQWFRNTVPVSSANLASLMLSPVTSADDGIYTCSATGPGGSATSLPAVVTVLHTFDTWAAEKGLFGPNAAPDADAEKDGINNFAEFIANTEPLVTATADERNVAHVAGGLERSGSVPTFLTASFRLNRRAAFAALEAEIATSLPGAFVPTAPTTAELLGTEPNGDQLWRYKFPVPDGAPPRFLQLRFTK